MKRIYWIILLIILGIIGYIGYCVGLRPTRILVVNAMKTQAADISLSNDTKQIKVKCIAADEMKKLSGYDAVILYNRNLALDEQQLQEIQRVAKKGVPIYTKAIKHSDLVIQENLTKEQIALLNGYFTNERQQNYRNGLRYLRSIATPHKWLKLSYDKPTEQLRDIYYHREYGKYFKSPEALTHYLKEKHLYHEGGMRIALLSGITFPMEGNRAHVDSLIDMLTARGMNVYPFTSVGKKREKMLHELQPDAIVYLAMGRLGNDSLIAWLQEKNIPIFAPFPLNASHEEWMKEGMPMSNGSKNARIIIPEIDGVMAPWGIATQNKDPQGYYVNTAETERCRSFADHVSRYLSLRTKPNKEKKIAIAYFKRPGKDALLASGLEVIPSLYHFLKRLRQEGYDVAGLPDNLETFSHQIKTEGIVLGSYARGAQEKYLSKGHPLWLTKQQYERWAKEVIMPQKYKEVTDRYGEAPGTLLTRGDSIAIACVRYGNIFLFPQPRPALGDDDFRLVHGVEVAPPHSYLAPYLYMQKGFEADALIHFGTHGNLEYTPGRDVAMRNTDWSDALIGSTPHFYFYTTGNVGESIIAKRRTHAVLLTYLTAPFMESGVRQKYASLLTAIHKALDVPNKDLILKIKKEIIQQGLHKELGLDGDLSKPYSEEELQQIDAHIEELSNEKVQGAYYTLGKPYSENDLLQTILAMKADPLAFEMAKKDRDAGKISKKQLDDYAFVAHHYLPAAKRNIIQNIRKDPYRQLLLSSTQTEINNMVRALNGGSVAPAPGGDPVLNPNVLPTGRNMYSINPENTPDEQAWEDGKRLAEQTLSDYKKQHGQYPQKVTYTFWAGEFINTQGATVAQALWMLGVEPVRDSHGRINDLKMIPIEKLGRPRIDVVVQVSGQLRDIATSRLQMITQAIKMVSEEKSDKNYVYTGTRQQEKLLVDKGVSPKRARELSTMRVFGPANNGYSTGMMNYIERSGSWEKASELVEGYLNNMGAIYGDEENWGQYEKELFGAALQGTEIVVQPRQSNTWGPISLDHVYEFTGGLSLTVKTLTGKEPEAYMADYRNRSNRRLQDMRQAVAVETRTTILNPEYVRERMKGDEGTAQEFGEVFRNIFGWSATRPSSLDKDIYNDLYKMYITDDNRLGVKDFFQKINPAAYQAMTSVMMESARKGYWKPTAEQLKTIAALHADITREAGAACTDFVCNNDKLQQYISQQLPQKEREQYTQQMSSVKETSTGQREMVLKEKKDKQTTVVNDSIIVLATIVIIAILLVYFIKRKQNRS